MEPPQPPIREAAAGPDEDRLESWKEISAYLKRDIRTLRRWEKNEGLPVHRHVHDKLASVYAYRSELDAWWAGRKPQVQEKEQQSAAKWRRWLPLAGAGAALAALLLFAALFLLRPRTSPPPAFQERPWVLIAQFENRTGEPVFDGALEYALERELSNSQFVNVAPHERIQDALQLMQKPPGTVLDRAVAREVALRDGGIRAVIAGRVEKMDTTYLLSALLVEPAQGAAVASFSEEAAGHREALEAVRRLSNSVRQALGERMADIRAAEAKLEKVTTPSLRALHLYSQGYAAAVDFQSAAAATLLRQAVAEDPEFASAHALLGGILARLGEREEARAHYQKAYELAGRTTHREQLSIEALYFNEAQADAQKGLEALTLLARLYPDHYMAVSNLIVAHVSRGQARASVPYVLRRADLRPGYFDHQMRAAHAAAVWGDGAQQAQPYLNRARDLAAADNSPVGAWRRAWVSLYPAQERWLRDDLDGAVQQARARAREQGAAAGEAAPLSSWHLASFYLVLGQPSAARETLDPASTRQIDLALFAMAQGDQAAARRHLQRAPPTYQAGILFTRLGALAEAERAMLHPEAPGRVESPFLPTIWQSLARGEIALARGDVDQAIPLLEQAMYMMANWPTAYYFLGADALSRAWEQQGDLAKSLHALEQTAPHGRPAVFWGPAPVFWMKNELRRAQLYRKLGRESEARQVEDQLRSLLTLADADHPMLRQLGAARQPVEGRW